MNFALFRSKETLGFLSVVEGVFSVATNTNFSEARQMKIASKAHTLSVDGAVKELETDVQRGLSSDEARRRLEEFGPNELMEKPRPGFLKLLFDQFNNFLIIILIVAAAVSMLLGETIDALAIIAIIALNAILGVTQESKAEQALAALKKMAAPVASVIRDGHQITVPASELVPGDVIVLEAGNYVPADLRLVETVNLKIEEASLTGESVPVDKAASLVLDEDSPLGDRKNCAFMGTMITYGRGKGVVVATGMETQIGLIAEMLQSYEEEPTPLQQRLDQLGKWLGTACLVICAVIFLIGLFRDTDLALLGEGIRTYLGTYEHQVVLLFMTAVSLAIAAVPEGLPAVVTICLALGMQRMVKRHALIRRLPAVETLGCTTVICSDKTGTLTQNEMTVVKTWTGDGWLQVTGEGYNPKGEFLNENSPQDPHRHVASSFLLYGSLLCNDAKLEETESPDGKRTWRMVGDPTEGALVVAAAKSGLWRDEVEKILPRVAEIPFDSERKRMTTIHKPSEEVPQSLKDHALWGHLPNSYIALVKGAPDIVLDLCNGVLGADGRVSPVTEDVKSHILGVNKEMANQALRVLAVAYRPLESVPEPCTPDAVERDLVFVGLLGMIDPARPEVKEAIKVAKEAGLKTVMVTGDYKDTATAIAREIGLLSPNGKVLSGQEIDRLSDDEFVAIANQIDVCARVSPQHKVKIVDALKAQEHVVAMTGDGVNDAPALKRADIGVAMGITGTDVTKETADMVLTDDNYASIVAAVEEGRIIYSNIRKFVFFLVSCNVGEILIIFLAMLTGLPIPLQPIQLLWLNLVTDGAPALALGLEKGEPDIMKRPPRPPKEPVINKDMRLGIAVQGIAMTAAILASFVYGLRAFPGHLEGAQTVAFATLVLSELLRAFTSRSEHYSVFSIGVASNRWMVLAVGSSLLLLLAVMYVPFLQPVFSTVPLGVSHWLSILPLAFVAPVAAEITKIFLRRRYVKWLEESA